MEDSDAEINRLLGDDQEVDENQLLDYQVNNTDHNNNVTNKLFVGGTPVKLIRRSVEPIRRKLSKVIQK